ncbi:SMI1/KNR4 family protein [Kribbella sp. NPDC051620]|uniref:SMI1/KNR4 family protein n=1 Tax=Kribbella sp. NPDC051620 TaxID=3364120 RepID=UPI003796CB47
MTVAVSWARITGWLAVNHPAMAAMINPPATAVDLRYLQAAVNRPLPGDLVELLELANGTEHRAVRGSLIPTLYNLVPVMEMLSRRQMEQEIQRRVYGAGPRAGEGEPAGRPTTEWLDSFLPIADAWDAGLLYVDLRDGERFGCVWEWYPEGGMESAPWWSGVGQMLEEIAGALVDGRPALRAYASGAVPPEKRLPPQLAGVDDGYLRWSSVPD